MTTPLRIHIAHLLKSHIETESSLDKIIDAVGKLTQQQEDTSSQRQCMELQANMLVAKAHLLDYNGDIEAAQRVASDAHAMYTTLAEQSHNTDSYTTSLIGLALWHNVHFERIGTFFDRLSREVWTHRDSDALSNQHDYFAYYGAALGVGGCKSTCGSCLEYAYEFYKNIIPVPNYDAITLLIHRNIRLPSRSVVRIREALLTYEHASSDRDEASKTAFDNMLVGLTQLGDES